MTPKSSSEKSYIRFFHAFPVYFSIDIYIDKKIFATDVMYQDFTEYASILPGEHNVILTKCKNTIPLFTKNITIPNKTIYTTVVAPKNRDALGFDIYTIEDTIRTIPNNNLLGRFAHFASNMANVDITLLDGTTVFKNIAPHQVTNYIPLKQGVYNLELRDITTGKSFLNIPNIRLKSSRFYSIYAIGNGKKDSPFQVIIPLDGNNYLRF